MGLIELLDRLEGIIEDSRKMPLTNKVVVATTSWSFLTRYGFLSRMK